MELTDEKKAEIDAMNYQQMLGKWRFAPIGSALFQKGPAFDYFDARMRRLKAEDPDGAVGASKAIGW